MNAGLALIWLRFVHILGAFLFLLAHGGSMMMAFRLRRESEPPRLQAVLELSGASYPLMGISLLVLLASGIVAGFVGNFWIRGWIWVSLGLLVAISVAMTPLGSLYYGRVRKAVGLPYFERMKEHPAGKPASKAEIAAVLDGALTRAIVLAVIGFVGLAVILWLMMFKPF